MPYFLGAHKRDGSGTENDSESSTDGSSQASEGMFSHSGFFFNLDRNLSVL